MKKRIKIRFRHFQEQKKSSLLLLYHYLGISWLFISHNKWGFVFRICFVSKNESLAGFETFLTRFFRKVFFFSSVGCRYRDFLEFSSC